MLDGIKTALARILASKKALLASLAAACNLVAVSMGTDPTEGAMMAGNALFGILLGAQILLDLRWGSTSDGTTPLPPDLPAPTEPE